MARRRSNGQGTLFKRTNGGPWIASWHDHTGKRCEQSTRTTDKRDAERIIAKRVSDAALRRHRVVDPVMEVIEEQSQCPLESHLADYEAKLVAQGRKAKTIDHNCKFIRAIANQANWTTVADISADAVNHYASRLKGQGRSAQTIKNHLSAVKSFTRWLANNHKLQYDPLASVTKPNPDADRRRERRMLLPNEWPWLQQVATGGPERFKMSGLERHLLYATAIQTGLRSAELRSLTRGRLFLNDDDPHITCKSRSTKNSKPACQYIQQDLADELREHVRSKAPQAPVFAMPSEHDVADMLRADLADARRAWLQTVKHDPDEYEGRQQSDFLAEVNHEGEHLDFHSLRHTCGSWLAMAGAHPNEIKSVMRHSTIRLTMDTYGHMLPGQEAETVARFPSMMGNQEEARATGTTGEIDHQLKPRQLLHETLRSSATQCDESVAEGEGDDTCKLNHAANMSDAVRRDASVGDKATFRTRTGDLRFTKPLPS